MTPPPRPGSIGTMTETRDPSGPAHRDGETPRTSAEDNGREAGKGDPGVTDPRASDPRAAALRANLAKRKRQQRARMTSKPETP